MIRGLRNLRIFKPKEERIVIIGNDACGKTTWLYRLKLGEIVNAIPTIGFNIETIEHGKIQYNFWDVGGTVVGSRNLFPRLTGPGCDKIRPLWRHYIDANCHVLYLHSPIDERMEDSLEGIRVAAEMLREVKTQYLFFSFTKQDLLPDDTRDTIIADHRGKFERLLERHATNLNWSFLDIPELSAYTGAGCQELLERIHNTMQTKVQSPKPWDKPPVPLTANQRPTKAELLARIQREQVNDLNAEAFWTAFETAKLSRWDHRSHLRAAYILLLETLKSGQHLYDCADSFLQHLQKLRGTDPDRFRNTEHRTMTIFWMYHLQLAILAFKHDQGLEKWPQPDMFHQVLLHSPHLMDGAIWKDYYTKDLMMSAEAKEFWRLPDLQRLPDLVQKVDPARGVVSKGPEEPYRLMRFAFTVVQRYLTTGQRRGWLVKQAVAALQSTTIRLRAQNPGIPPSSETQAYFWIQIVHTALATVQHTALKTKRILVSIDRLSFASFQVLFDMEPDLWKKYYSPKVWDSLEARVEFKLPDLAPLPNVLAVPSSSNVLLAFEKQIDSARIGMAPELPSMEELALWTNILLDEVDSLDPDELASQEIKNHAHLLWFLFQALSVNAEDEKDIPLVSRATTAMMQLSGTYVPSLTAKAFWTQQVLHACTKKDAAGLKFDGFLRAFPHLVYPDLILSYYSHELLRSLEANEIIVQADRRKMHAFIPENGKAEEDEWIVL